MFVLLLTLGTSVLSLLRFSLVILPRDLVWLVLSDCNNPFRGGLVRGISLPLAMVMSLEDSFVFVSLKHLVFLRFQMFWCSVLDL